MEETDHTAHDISGVSAPEIVGLPSPVAVTLFEKGRARAVAAFEDESLMVALRRAGLPLLAVCGGKGTCGTCKVAFAPAWAAKLPEAEKRELRLLAHIKAGEGERLSCRIRLVAALDGLEVGACDQPHTQGE
jgi:ferredoxin